MSKLLILPLLISALVLSGCQRAASPTTSETPASVQTQKVGETTKSGKVTKIGQKFYLEMAGSKTMEIDSYALNLSAYEGQTLKVTGQYSGDTLFVGKIE